VELVCARLAHVDLDERPGELLHLVGRGRLAGTQPHDDVAVADRMAGPHGELVHLPVALVEQPKHRDPLGHRRRTGGQLGDGLRHVDGGDVLRVVLVLKLGAARRASGERQQAGQRAGPSRPRHDQPGSQG
jgi:hypothetical protein